MPRQLRATSLCSPEATGIHTIASFIGLELLRYRDRNGLTQRDMARRCGVSRSRYNQIEAGRPTTGIHVVTLMRLAEGCETTPDGMLGFSLKWPKPARDIYFGLRSQPPRPEQPREAVERDHTHS